MSRMVWRLVKIAPDVAWSCLTFTPVLALVFRGSARPLELTVLGARFPLLGIPTIYATTYLMDDTGIVTLVSLIVALVALLLTLGQLSQQLLGTADGYRRCNAEVMGQWSSTRLRRPRLRELRLEVIFETPHFRIGKPGEVMDKWVFSKSYFSKGLAIDGSRKSIEATMTPTNLPFGFEGTFHVGWLRLLERLQSQQKELGMPSVHEENPDAREKSLGKMTGVGILRRAWSWDLLPTDVTRPLASSHLRDLLIIGYRFGMTWRGLGPSETVSADGWGHSFQSIQIRGLGLVLQYDFADYIGSQYESRFDQRQPPQFIPAWRADILPFGMIPTDPVFSGQFRRYFDLGGGNGNLDSIIDMFATLGLGRLARRKLATSTAREEFADIPRGGSILNGFCDAFYLVMPFLPLDGLGLKDYVPPLPHDIHSVCTSAEGRVVFYLSLERLLDRIEPKSPQLQRIFDFLRHMARHYPDRFARSESLKGRKWTILFHDALSSEFNATNEYFFGLEHHPDRHDEPTRVDGASAYKGMLVAHIEMAVAAVEEVDGKSESDYRGYSEQDLPVVPPNPQTVKTRLSELAHTYVDKLERLQDELPTTKHAAFGLWHKLGRDKIRDAWWTMMLRSFIWSLSVDPIRLEGYPLPSRYYRSSTPVWIT